VPSAFTKTKTFTHIAHHPPMKILIIFIILLLALNSTHGMYSFYEFLEGDWAVERTTFSAKALGTVEPSVYGRYQFIPTNGTLTGYYYENTTENQEELLQQITVEFETLTTGEFKVRDVKAEDEEITFKTLFAFDFINRTHMALSTDEWSPPSHKFYQFIAPSPSTFILNIYSSKDSSHELLIDTITAVKTIKQVFTQTWYSRLLSNPMLLIGVLLVSRYFKGGRQATPVRPNRAQAAAIKKNKNKPNEQGVIEEENSTTETNAENKETESNKDK